MTNDELKIQFFTAICPVVKPRFLDGFFCAYVTIFYVDITAIILFDSCTINYMTLRFVLVACDSFVQQYEDSVSYT